MNSPQTCPVPGGVLRPASDADVQALLALERANMRAQIERFYPGSWDDARAEELIRARLSRARVLTCADTLAGFYYWEPEDEHTALLDSLQVACPFRNRGLGTWLMACFESEVVAQGFRAIVLAVHEGNPARRLYERLGYAVVGDDGPHAWGMRKLLSG